MDLFVNVLERKQGKEKESIPGVGRAGFTPAGSGRRTDARRTETGLQVVG